MPTFDPTNLTAHFDASDASRIWTDTGMTTPASDADPVAAWDDVGDAVDRALFQTGSNRPIYRVPGVNGLNAVDFNGSTQYMLCYNDAFVTAQAISNFITNSAYALFTAILLQGNGTNLANIYDNAAVVCDAGGFWGLHYKTVAGVHSLHAYNWDGAAKTVSQNVSQSVVIITAQRFGTGTLGLAVDLGSESTTASGNISNVSGQLVAGRSLQAGAGHFNGLVLEKLYYNVHKSGTGYDDTRQYLYDKWNGIVAANTFPALTVAI